MARYLWPLVALLLFGARATPALALAESPTDPVQDDAADPADEEEDTPLDEGVPTDSPPTVEVTRDANKAYLRGDGVIPAAKPTEVSSSSSGVLGAFAVLVILGATAAYFSRKRIPRELRATQIQMAVVAKLGLGPKAQIALVSVGREALLIGVTEQGITTLRTYTEAELPSLTPALAPSKNESVQAKTDTPSLAAPSALFQSLLEKASGVKTAAPNEVARVSARPASDEMEEEIPDHLVRALDAAGLSGRGFEAPEGQAKELAQRFKELRS